MAIGALVLRLEQLVVESPKTLSLGTGVTTREGRLLCRGGGIIVVEMLRRRGRRGRRFRVVDGEATRHVLVRHG